MRVTCSAKAFFEVVDVLIEDLAEELVLRSLRASPADVKDSLVVKSLAFVNSVSRTLISLSNISAVSLIVG